MYNHENQEFSEKLMQQINLIRSEKKFNLHKATEIAVRTNKIIESMLAGGAKFSYISRTGQRRDVTGTLTTYTRVFGKMYDHTKTSQFIPYFDMDNGIWSVFHISSVVV